jgi:hypothetical protein
VVGGDAGSADESPDALREQAIVALDEFIQATSDAREELGTFQAALEQNRTYLSEGGRAVDITSLFDVPALRSSLTDGLERVEHARMACRRRLWRLQLSEGKTIADIARSWGLSRQLVSRALSSSDVPDEPDQPVT